MQSPEPWTSDRGPETASAALGEMLAQEVLDSFNSLATAPHTMVSGHGHLDDCSDPGVMSTTSSALSPTPGTSAPGKGSIAHETLHPLCMNLSYGGLIEVDADCHGMVVKLDSRSRTSSDLVRLQFFASQDDMLSDRDPLRVMHGHVPDRAARARAKGMEFFKIEEADSTSFDVTSSSLEDALSINALGRITLPPPLVKQSSSSTTASASSASPRPPSGTVQRAVTTSQGTARSSNETQSQMAARHWTRLKDVPALMQSTTFRSFALPGIRRLWFRFDAPPGAEKPPLKMNALVGSLDLLPAGTLRASPSPSTERNDSVHSEQDEDLSQEDMGLKALFTFLGAENAGDSAELADVGSRNIKRAESDDKSDARDACSQGGSKLPSCLAAPADVRLTRGKWFYEVTVDSLTDQTALDDNLVRIGWAHLELTSALQRGEGRKANEGSLSWAVGMRYAANEHAGTPQPEQAISQLERQDSRHSLKPAKQALGWVCDSKTGLSTSTVAQAEAARSAERKEYADAAPFPEDLRKSEGTPNPTESNEMSRAEAEAKGVAFPILGSDNGNLGLGLGQRGFIWLGGHPMVRATHRLEPTDVIGCAIDVDCGKVWFSVNGKWTAGGPDEEESGSTLGSCVLGIDIFRVGNGVRPCVSVRGKACLSVNFGATPFRHAPPGDAFPPVILRDVHVQASADDRSGENVFYVEAAFAIVSEVSVTPLVLNRGSIVRMPEAVFHFVSRWLVAMVVGIRRRSCAFGTSSPPSCIVSIFIDTQDMPWSVSDCTRSFSRLLFPLVEPIVAETKIGGGICVSDSAGHRPRKSSQSSTAPDEDANTNWGFRFVVDPLRGIPYRVVREVELVCRFGGGSRPGAGSSSVGSQVGLGGAREGSALIC